MAVISDKKLINAWVGHPNYSIIDNQASGGFKNKIDTLFLKLQASNLKQKAWKTKQGINFEMEAAPGTLSRHGT